MDPTHQEPWQIGSGQPAERGSGERQVQFPPDVQAYLRDVQKVFALPEIVQAVESLANLRVLVIGDLIIDEYCYCRVSGTVSKWPVLAAVYQGILQMAGGGAVVARHVKQFAREVHYVCTIGDQDENYRCASRILEQEEISTRYFTWPSSFTVAKRRYLTGGYPNPLAPRLRLQDALNIRLLEVGFLPDLPLPAAVEAELCAYLDEVVPTYDLVILADFGHGLVSPQVGEVIAARARGWSVNAQTNSSNFGFNRITKYQGPDFVCVDELEARLPLGDRGTTLDAIVKDLQQQMACTSIMVTQGSQGLVLFNDHVVSRAPALATRVVDTVGAGDAVLAVASLCRAKDLPDTLTAFLSACAGAIASGIVGNEEPIRKREMFAFVKDVLT